MKGFRFLKLMCSKKKFSLLKEKSKYNFTLHEIILGLKLNLLGYRNNIHEQILDIKDDMAFMQVENCKLFVPEHTFQSGELKHIYNEVFTPHKKNQHAYETEYLQIKNGDCVIDAGACEGFFIKYALQRGAEMVFAFEPLKSLSDGLHLTYKKEINAKKVKIINKGLSDINENVKFDYGNNYICEAKMNSCGLEVCEVTSLDLMIDIGVIPRIDFIKMDIEGAEILAIKGAKKTIRAYKPKLAIAVYHEYENGNIIKNLLLEYRADYTIRFGGCYTFEKPYRPFMLYAY